MKNKERLRKSHSSEGSMRGDSELQCGLLGWVWTRKRTVRGEPGEVQESMEFSLVKMCQCWFRSFGNVTLLRFAKEETE